MELMGYSLNYMHLVALLVSIVVVYTAYSYFNKNKNNTESISTDEELLKPNAFQSNKEIKMYGKDSCPWCVKQKEELGDLFDNVKYIDCEKGTCDNIEALPTWDIDGEITEGFLTKQEFLQKCEK